MDRHRSKGVTIFGILIIVTSLLQMRTLLNFSYTNYVYTFSTFLPEEIILMRYFASWSLRIVGLVSGIGILFLNNKCRKMALYLFFFTICTIYWKYPYFVFVNQAPYLDQMLLPRLRLHLGYGFPTFSSVVGGSVVCARIMDILFAGIFIYYFTRPKVKKQFNATSEENGGYGLIEDFLRGKRAQTADKLIPHNLREGKILDVGCGVTPAFLFNTKFKYKYGLDESIKNFSSKENILMEKIDLEKDIRFPFEDNFFDTVTMLAVFGHLDPDRILAVLKEIKRTLKPSGRFIMTTPCRWSAKLIVLMYKLRFIDPDKARGHKGAYSRDFIYTSFEKAGFEREKMRFGYFELFMNSWFYVDK